MLVNLTILYAITALYVIYHFYEFEDKLSPIILGLLWPIFVVGYIVEMIKHKRSK